MLELMTGSDDDVLAIRAWGLLTEDDYRDLEGILAARERLRVLFLMDETFRGWNAGAAWLNTRLDLRRRRDFEKVAIVGAPTWERWCARLAGLLVAGEIKTFSRDELSAARAWLRS